MTNQLQKMTADTIAVLQERQALPDAANSATVRYAADYIVKKSAFTPFFAALGITRGSQIGRTFDQIRGLAFFKTVLHLYYAKQYYGDSVPKLDRVLAGFKDLPWEHVAKEAGYYYTEARRSARHLANCSIGIGTKAEEHHAHVRENLGMLLRQNCSTFDLLNMARCLGSSVDSIALAIFITERQYDAVAQTWLEENSFAVVDAFRRYGLSRALLTNCHGFKISVRHEQKHMLPKTHKDKCVVVGYTHAALNSLATAYQDTCIEFLIQSETCELCEPVELGDIKQQN